MPPLGHPERARVRRLRFLVEENGLTGRELGRILGDETLGNRVLRGERELSKAHIRKLADHFGVSPALFL